MTQLTDLHLSGCILDHQPTFTGFGSLKSLSVFELTTCTKTLLQLLSSCPLLKTLIMKIDNGTIEICADTTT
nr:hypothetical protein [Tanacetum cinerariifolium]